MIKLTSRVLLPIFVLLLAATCVAPPVLITPAPDAATPSAVEQAEPSLLAAVEYNLGEATAIQERFPEGDRFRDMPVRLNGLIAAPSEGNGPFPVS